MRKSLIYLLSAVMIVLVGCSAEEMGTEPKKEPVKQEQPKKDIKKEPKIDTSMYKAKDVELTDAVDTNQHITLKVKASDQVKPGLAFQNAATDTYDFLLQDNVKQAKTVTVLVQQQGKKIAQYTVDTSKFIRNDEEPMGQVVLDASEVEMMSQEVEEYTQVMGLKINKKQG